MDSENKRNAFNGISGPVRGKRKTFNWDSGSLSSWVEQKSEGARNGEAGIPQVIG
jgi:hypothetical protein